VPPPGVPSSTDRPEASAWSGSDLLLLPRELRDIIYEFYLPETDGFVHDGRLGKVTTRSINPMGISLAFICYAIFDELFSHITFYTSLSGTTKENAGLSHSDIGKLEACKE
jgi:hypothetical protein